MKFRMGLKRMRFDPRLYLSDLDNRVKEVVAESASIWLNSALERIPTWSGASRATFENLASAIGESVPISLAQNAPDRIALGRLNSRGGLERTRAGSWNFYYETSLRYLIDNDQRNVPRGEGGVIWGLRDPGPYNTGERANAAVLSYYANVASTILPPVTITE